MNLVRFVLRAATGMILCGAGVAKAQFVSVYGLFNPMDVNNIQTGSVYSGGTYVNKTDRLWAHGFGGGVTVNFLNLHVIKLGVDLRGSRQSGTDGADTAQAALRLGIQPPLLHLKPYVQAGFGYLETRTVDLSTTPSNPTPAGGTFTNRYSTFGVHAGVDKPLFPFVDFRIIEFGYTKAVDTGIFSSNSSNVNSYSFATGVVAHF